MSLGRPLEVHIPFRCGRRTEAAGGHTIIVRIHGRRSLYDFVNAALWQVLKTSKPVARRHIVGSIARSLHGHRTEAARWSCGQRKILDGKFGKKNRTMIEALGISVSTPPPPPFPQLSQDCRTVPVQCP